MIYRIYVEKKIKISADKIKNDIKNLLGIKAEDVREILRYDVENLSESDFTSSISTVFSEPPVDNVYLENIEIEDKYKVFAISFLNGQYDQRADSCAQCIQLLTHKARPIVKCARLIAVSGVTDEELSRIEKHLINPVDCEKASLEKPLSLSSENLKVEPVAVVDGFIAMTDEQILKYHRANGFAMSGKDLIFVRDYFKSENRNPTETEIKVIDTYWSDHCRHTTFSTHLKNVEINSDNPNIKKSWDLYQELYGEFNAKRPSKYPCLMDIATIAVKKLKKLGKLNDLDESEEINACSINVEAIVDGEKQDWLVMFKNETHNHPTEIEPFGGAATCLGGAIRDPLSGRTFVYQAMRITGASDPREHIKDTLKGKLPQRVLTRTSAAGFSSYGNQIGLATGIVDEVYHNGYKAKRLETGFVVGANLKANVVRESPIAGDLIILLGGETGRDGCGGATGSSKAHNLESVEKCGAEVQKGNPLTERKIQRLFLNPEVTTLIKRCNDFGAGGVSVAIGELADALEINLDLVPKKYEGLTGTEIAISESQERMAVVVDKNDAEKFIKLAEEENLGAMVVAKVCSDNRMKMTHLGKTIVDISRDFLNTNGVKQEIDAEIDDNTTDYFESGKVGKDFSETVKINIGSLGVCSKKGLSEIFDSTIGARSVFMPWGGKKQLTPSIAMAAKLPLIKGETDMATVSSWGYSPNLMSTSSYTGAIYSICTSVSKVVATGADKNRIRLTFQEFFKRLNSDKKRWGEPLSALLGALQAQISLQLGAIGGKDSMSGTFENIDVPPTLISFALAPQLASKLITNVLKNLNKKLYVLKLRVDENKIPDFEYLNKLYDVIHTNIESKNTDFATVVEEGGILSAVIKSCLGNSLGFNFKGDIKDLVNPYFASLVVSAENISKFEGFDITYIGETAEDYFTFGDEKISIEEAEKAYTSTLENVFKSKAEYSGEIKPCDYTLNDKAINFRTKIAKPKVFIPVFPGTNCEIDTARRFEKAGGEPLIYVIKNRSAEDIMSSVKEISKLIKSSNIIAFPGGFSGGDEPDGSGKFIATTFNNPFITEQITDLLENRDGLIIGICNGFQALVKLGLVPFGKVTKMTETSPTLTFNTITRHVSTLCDIRVATNKSPWLSNVKVGEVYKVPVSHGEGRFICNEVELDKLIKNGQIATQYVDFNGKPQMETPYNPNGSINAIEGIISIDGRVFGKMGHSERIGDNLYKNCEGNFDMKIFEAGVNYFK